MASMEHCETVLLVMNVACISGCIVRMNTLLQEGIVCFTTVGSFAITMQHPKGGRQDIEQAAYI